jgi:hypothetical protein
LTMKPAYGLDEESPVDEIHGKVWIFVRNLRKVEVWTSFLVFSLVLESGSRSAIFCVVAEALGFNLM